LPLLGRIHVMDTDSIKIGPVKCTETPEGNIYDVVIAVENIMRYDYGVAYKSAFALQEMVHTARQSGVDVPVTLNHPELLPGDQWSTRPTVGRLLNGSLFYDYQDNKVKAQMLVYRANQWVIDAINSRRIEGVSLGYDRKLVWGLGHFSQEQYDVRHEAMLMDHVALIYTGQPRCPVGTCGIDQDVEITENYIRIPVAEPTGGEVRTIVMSKDDGILALIEIKNGTSRVITMLFRKDKGWSLDKAKQWIKDHLPNGSSADKDDTMEQDAEWTRAFINDLPDSSFAYIEPGGKKDDQGKTVPRSLRHLPYKDAEGKIDPAHVRNALARLPQTNLSAEAKAEARRKLIAAAREAGVQVSEDTKSKDNMAEDEEASKPPEETQEEAGAEETKDQATENQGAESDCQKELDALRKEYEGKIEEAKKEADAKLEKTVEGLRTEFQKEIDALVKKQEARGDGTDADGTPATGEKSVVPSVETRKKEIDSYKEQAWEAAKSNFVGSKTK